MWLDGARQELTYILSKNKLLLNNNNNIIIIINIIGQ